MAKRHRLTSVETVTENDSWLFTVRDATGGTEEVILVPCEDGDGAGVQAWVNRCTHEAQRLHREDIGAVIRNGEIVCPKHGSLFDTCSGYCENGEAAKTTLVSIAVTVDDGQVYLVDDDIDFVGTGRIDDDSDDDGPSSTSHLQF